MVHSAARPEKTRLGRGDGPAARQRLLGEGDLSGLSLVAGYSLAQALDMQHRHELRVKWPNDLWYRQRKLGGILIEICTQGRQRQAVIGVGINVAAPPPLPPGVTGQAVAQAPAWVQEFAPNATAPSVLDQLAVRPKRRPRSSCDQPSISCSHTTVRASGGRRRNRVSASAASAA